MVTSEQQSGMIHDILEGIGWKNETKRFLCSYRVTSHRSSASHPVIALSIRNTRTILHEYKTGEQNN